MRKRKKANVVRGVGKGEEGPRGRPRFDLFLVSVEIVAYLKQSGDML